MAKNTAFISLLLCLLLVAATEMQMAEGHDCGKKSDKWHGPCQYTFKCNQHCKHLFGHKYYGICKKYKGGHNNDWSNYACYCYSPCH
ncbi:hypothetical protein RDI58_017389 [Solanum bulbocastanum]|uniref:Defensin-like protein 19 n=1 Tax=Solanum bulbocastanum TaxID=147425 RepID=A0AAN8T9F3_SOLBU